MLWNVKVVLWNVKGVLWYLKDVLWNEKCVGIDTEDVKRAGA